MTDERELADAEPIKALKIEYFCYDQFKSRRYWLVACCSLCLSLLAESWLPQRFAHFRFNICAAIDADFALIESEHGHELVPIELIQEWSLHEQASGCCGSRPEAPRGSMLAVEERMFIYRNTRFFFDSQLHDYTPIDSQLDSFTAVTVEKLRHIVSHGSASEERDLKIKRLGGNIINVVVKSWMQIMREEVFQPFFVFQIFSVLLWCFEEYFVFAGVIAAMAMISAAVTLIETRNSLTRISEMARFECPVCVYLPDQSTESPWQILNSSQLVPGDIICIDSSIDVLPCDCALLDGSCVMNEATLTGESVPVLKIAHDISASRHSTDRVRLSAPTELEAIYHSDSDGALPLDHQHTLFSSTRVLQAKPHHVDGRVLAVVTRTGFNTVKGELVRSILHPRPSHFRFVEQSYRFVAVLCVVALIGLTATVWRMQDVHAAVSLMILRGLDLVTIVVPPTLPLAMSVGVNFALRALAKRQIFCIAPARINVAGKIKLMCFDKTGTLTQDTLQMSGVVELRSTESRELLEQATQCVSELRTPWLRQALACCHSVTLIDSASAPNEPQLIGDPLDIELIKFSGAHVSEHVDAASGVRVQQVSVDDQVFSIEQRFEFCSVRRRSSVIVASNQIRRVFCKGAPESIVSHCVTDSFPSDIFDRVAEFTARGSRVLAIATKPLSDAQFDADTDSETIRNACESSLQFLGLLILENRLKSATVDAIAELNAARIRSVMCTGDHVLTAVAVARSAGIIDTETGIFVASLKNNRIEWHLSSDATVSLDSDTLKPMHSELLSSTVMPFDRYELAVTGDVFEHLHVKWQEDLSMRQVNDNQVGLSSPFHRVLMGTAVFARMTPSQKALAVTEFQHCGLYVGACGDGGNDSLMLRCAHMGVSLSESDASIAAPFTCTQPDISCIPTLLKEGRSSLVTSFQLFRFMALYSTIQFFAVILLYFVGTVLGNYQYLFQDLAVVFPCTVLMGMSPASAELTVKRPSGNLLSVRNLVTTLCHMCICFGFQFMVFYATFNEPTFVDLSTEEQVPLTWHTTTLYYLSNLQYLVMAALMCLGLPWKQAHRNYQFIGWYCLSLLFCLLLLFAPYSPTCFFTVDEVDVPGHLRSFIFGCAILNALLCTAFELWLTPLIVQYLKHRQTSGIESVLGAGRSGKACHLLRQEFESGWLNQIRPRVVEISIDDDPLPM